MALGVLTLAKGPSHQPVGYLSKELDLVAHGYPACLLRTLAAVAILVPEATKLMGQDLTVHAPHHTQGFLAPDNSHWLTDN